MALKAAFNVSKSVHVVSLSVIMVNKNQH